MTSQGPQESPLSRARAFIIERYLTVDLRTLALFRVVFGVFLFCNLIDRMGGLHGTTFFTDDGLAPSYAITQWHHTYTWSLMFAVTTQNHLRAAIAFIIFVYTAFTVGWHTRLMQFLVAVIIVSLNQRNIMLENGGVWVLNFIAVFTAFLPLGARFSLDALRLPRPEKNTVTRLAYGAIVLELAIIYILTGVHKTGGAWHDGTAIHLTLWHGRVVNNLGMWMRSHQPAWFSPVMTRGTLFTEVTLFFLILSPWHQRDARRVAIVLIIALHTGIALFMTLGPFSYCMMCLGLLLLGPEDWDAILARVRPRVGARFDRAEAWLGQIFGPRVAPPELAPPARSLRRGIELAREAGTGVMYTAVLLIVLHVNPAMPKATTSGQPPTFALAIVDSLRMEQRWTMFAPDAPHSDSMLVVDGELADGRHVDPLTGEPPDFEPILHENDLNEQWRDYVYRIGQDKYTRFRPFLRDFLMRIHTFPEAKIHEPLKRVDVYWVTHKSPLRPGQRVGPITRKLLISSHDAAAHDPAASKDAPSQHDGAATHEGAASHDGAATREGAASHGGPAGHDAPASRESHEGPATQEAPEGPAVHEAPASRSEPDPAPKATD